jgi:hypothetical protein
MMHPVNGSQRVDRNGKTARAALLAHIAYETAGAARTRSSLRPLATEGGMFKAKPAQCARRDREGVFARLFEIKSKVSATPAPHPLLSSPAKAGDPVFQRRQ